MTAPRRLSGLTIPRLLSLALIGLATAAGLVCAYLEFFDRALDPASKLARGAADGLELALLAIVAGAYLYTRPDTIRSEPRKHQALGRWVMIPLCGLILVGAFLRFHRLDQQSMWYDELTTADNVTGGDLSHAVKPGGRVLDSWPGYHIPLYFFVQAAGPSEFSLRFPSTLLGILMIPTVFVVGRRMFSDREGLLAAAFVTVLNAAVYYGQEARMYSLLMFLSAISGYFWLRLAECLYWRRRPPPFMTLGYAAALALMNYTHYYGLLLAAIQGLGAVLAMASTRRLSVPFITAFVAMGLTYMPWLPMLYQDSHNTTFLAAYLPASLQVMGREFLTFLTDDKVLAVLITALCGAGLVIAAWKSLKKRPQTAQPLLLTPAVLLGAWLLMPTLLAYFRSLTATPIIVYRYFLVTLPAIGILVARTITRLPLSRMRQYAVGAVLSVVLIGQLFWSGYYTEPHTTQVRQAVSYIIEHDQQYHDSVIAITMLGTVPQIDYYFRRYNASHQVDIKLSPPLAEEGHQRIVDANTRYVWLIGEDTFVNPDLLDKLNQDYTQIDMQRYYAVTVWLYERK